MPKQLTGKVSAALDYLGDEQSAEQLRPYVEWQLKGLMEVVCLEHMNTPELMALVAVLAPVFSRAIGGPPPEPKRRLRLAG